MDDPLYSGCLNVGRAVVRARNIKLVLVVVQSTSKGKLS